MVWKLLYEIIHEIVCNRKFFVGIFVEIVVETFYRNFCGNLYGYFVEIGVESFGKFFGAIFQGICSIFVAFCSKNHTSLNSPNLPGNMYVNVFWSALVEIIGYLSIMLLIKRFSRRRCMIISQTIAGLACLSSIPLIYISYSPTA